MNQKKSINQFRKSTYEIFQNAKTSNHSAGDLTVLGVLGKETTKQEFIKKLEERKKSSGGLHDKFKPVLKDRPWQNILVNLNTQLQKVKDIGDETEEQDEEFNPM